MTVYVITLNTTNLRFTLEMTVIRDGMSMKYRIAENRNNPIMNRKVNWNFRDRDIMSHKIKSPVLADVLEVPEPVSYTHLTLPTKA